MIRQIQKIENRIENGYLGEIMAYKPTGEIGVVDAVTESQTGWTTEITLKLKDGLVKTGLPTDFIDATGKQRAQFLS